MNNLSVHHNIPIGEDYNKRLDNNNLLTVCSVHHEMCESGEISKEIVQKIIDEQEKEDWIELLEYTKQKYMSMKMEI